MVFSSSVFIFAFLPVTIICYKLAGSISMRAQNVIMLISSLIFYSWGGLRCLILILAMVAINYLTGLWIDRSEHRKLALTAGVVIDVLILMVFKYLNLLVQSVEGIAHALGHASFSLNIPHVPLPIGISFFTFQIISYLIDLYRGEVTVQKSIINLTVYIMMFPQLVAGPIVRYVDVEERIDRRTTTAEMEHSGIRRFMIGVAKKVLLANSMGDFADVIFGISGKVNFIWAWLGVIVYALQIFLDFSAYSDMAIGMGWIFGFHFPENFNAPYISKSIQEFWRRWHISLSTWFRDYVYIPLGGNRKGVFRTYINLIIVFLLTGFWHGAAWQFLFWGVYHGIFLVIERVGLSRVLNRLPAIVGHVYTLLVVLIGWVFFRAGTLTDAWIYLQNMFTFEWTAWNSIVIMRNLSGKFLFFLAISVVACLPVPQRLSGGFKKHALVGDILTLTCFCCALAFMVGDTYNPFIYFQF